MLGKAAFTGRLVSGAQLPPIEPLILAQTRVSISVLLLAPLLLLVRGRDTLSMPLRDVLRCMVLGVLGLAGSNYAYYAAIELTTVATAIIVQYTAPIWVLLYMLVRRTHRATTARVIAVGLAVVGSALAIGGTGGSGLRLHPAGVFWAMVAAVSFAFYNIFGHGLLERYERWRVVVYAMAGAALFWLLFNPPWKIVAANYSGEQWMFLAVFAVTSMLLPFSLYFAGLQHLDATRAIVTSCLEPVFAVLLAAMFLGENFSAIQAVGMLVVLAATVMVQQRERQKPADEADPAVPMQ